MASQASCVKLALSSPTPKPNPPCHHWRESYLKKKKKNVALTKRDKQDGPGQLKYPKAAAGHKSAHRVV